MLGDDKRRLTDSAAQGSTTHSDSKINSKATSGAVKKSPHQGFDPTHESVHDMIIDLITTFTTGKGKWEGTCFFD